MIGRSGDRVICCAWRFFATTGSSVLFVALMLTSNPVAADCVFIGKPPIPTFAPASGNLRLAANRDGKPVSFALITVTKYGSGSPLSRFATDENGVLSSARLADGDYNVHVLAADGSAASLLVRVVAGMSEETTSFDLSLQKIRDSCCEALFLPDVVADRANIGQLKGIVRDPTGAEMPRATVIIVSRESKSHSVMELSTGSHGAFATDLPNGEYVAFFSSPGFRTKIVRFVIHHKEQRSWMCG